MSNTPSNSQHVRRLLDTAFNAIEKKDVSTAVDCCARLARLIRDPYSFSFFAFLQESARREATRNIVRAFSDIDREKINVISEKAINRALPHFEIDKNEAAVLEAKDGSLLFVRSNNLDNEVEACDRHIAALELPSGLTPLDLGVFYKENQKPKHTLLVKRALLQKIKSRILSACSNYLGEVEHQNIANENAGNELYDQTNSAIAFLREKAPKAASMMIASVRHYTEETEEGYSSSLLQIRRCLKEVADQLLPATGKSGLSDDKFLNRLSYYVEKVTGTKNKFAQIEVEFLEKILREINDRASKGVHRSANARETKQIMLTTVFYINTIADLTEFQPKSTQT